MPARGRSCSTCDNRHEVVVGDADMGVAELQCRADPATAQLRPPRVRTDEYHALADAAFDMSEVAADMGEDELAESALELSVSVSAVNEGDFDTERWPTVRPDEWCGRWVAESKPEPPKPTGFAARGHLGGGADVLGPGSHGEA